MTFNMSCIGHLNPPTLMLVLAPLTTNVWTWSLIPSLAYIEFCLKIHHYLASPESPNFIQEDKSTQVTQKNI